MSHHVQKKMLGYAGEYLVAARLSLMGYLVTITPKGAPEIDLLVYDIERRKVATIQVKTIRQNYVHLGVKAKREEIDRKLKDKIKDPYVIVHIPSDWNSAKFYIIPPKDLRELARKEYFEWLNKPTHTKAREELEKTPQPLLVSIRSLGSFLEKWENIWTYELKRKTVCCTFDYSRRSCCGIRASNLNLTELMEK